MKKINKKASTNSSPHLERGNESNIIKKTEAALVAEIKKLQQKIEGLEKKQASPKLNSKKNTLLKESEERFRLLSNATFEAILFSRDGIVIDANKPFLEMFGYKSVNEVKGKSLVDDFVDEEKLKSARKSLLKSETEIMELSVKRKDGSFITVESKGQDIPFNGQAIRATVIYNITERKQYEKELKRSRENYKGLVDHSPDGIFIHTGGRIVFANPSAYKIMEVGSFEELNKKNVFDFWLPESEEAIKERMLLDSLSGSQFFREMKIKTAKGNIIELEVQAVPIFYNGQEAIQVVMHKIDSEKLLAKEQLRVQLAEEANQKLQQEITERKTTERILESTQKYARLLIDSSMDMICASDKDGYIIEFNLAAQKTFGYELDEVIGKHVNILFDSSYYKTTSKTIYEKGIYSDEVIGEVVNVKKNGQKFISFLSASLLKDEDGEIIGAMGVSRDISEIKKTEQELRDSEESYRAIYNQALVGIAQVNLEGEFIQVNEHLCNILGYSKEELYKKTVMDITFPDDFEKIEDFKEKFIRAGIEKNTIEKRFLHKDGKIININLALSIVKDVEGNPQHFISAFQDITNRIKTEQEKQAQSAKLKAIFESSSHIIWTIDREHCLTSFNKNFIQHMKMRYGITPSLGFSMVKDNMVSSEEYNNHWINKYKQVFKGIPQYFETKLIDKDKNIIWRDIYLNPIRDEKGNVIEVSGIAHDITEKKISEDKIRQSLQEKEILLKEVHHRVKNNLQVISSILNLQSSYVKDEGTLNILKESQNRIKSMAFIHESLYQTKDFSSINFSEYVLNLLQNLMHSYANLSPEVELKLDIQPVFLNLDLAIPCGLIINEIVSNALKYAFIDNSEGGEITFKLATEGENLILIIGDNGKGLPSHIDFKNTESLGLQLVVTLTDQLSGKIKLDTKKGTNYTIAFKQNQVKNRI